MRAARGLALVICLVVLAAAASLLQIHLLVRSPVLAPANLLHLLYRHGLFAEAGRVTDALVAELGAGLSPADQQALRSAIQQTFDYQRLSALVGYAAGTARNVFAGGGAGAALAVDLAALKKAFEADLVSAGASLELVLGARLALTQVPDRIEAGPEQLFGPLPPWIRTGLGISLQAGVLGGLLTTMLVLALAGRRRGLQLVGTACFLSGLGLLAASVGLDYVLASVPLEPGLAALPVPLSSVSAIRGALEASWHGLVAQSRLIPSVTALAGATAVGLGAFIGPASPAGRRGRRS